MGPPGGTTVKEEETVITTVTTVEPIYSRQKFISMAKKSIFGSACINFLLSLIALIMIAVAAAQAKINIQSVKQVVDDWGYQPFVDIIVRNENCRSGEVTLFGNYYNGVRSGCDDDLMGYTPYKCPRDNSGKKKDSSCKDEECKYKISGFSGSTNYDINRRRMCGVRGGLPYKDAVRADFSTGQCPSGYVACSSRTSVENTICVTSNDLGSCPITYAAFATQN